MLEQLEDIVRELGVRLMQWRREGIVDGRWEGTELKAEADLRAHRFLTDHLTRIAPKIPIVSEEDLSSQNVCRLPDYWLIDPIDGTASFCGGFDGFVTQMALMHQQQPVLGLIHAPALDLTYAASANGAATSNGVVLEVHGRASSELTLIDNYPEPRGIARTLFDQLPCTSYVESGSLGLKICRIADGTADLFVKDVVVKDWDLAPAHLVLSRAGGILTTIDGDNIPYDGDYARHGIIAAADPSLAARVRKWQSSRSTEIHDDRLSRRVMPE